MALSKNINLYDDVRRILDTALQNLPAKLKFPTRGKAVQWRQRAYYYRKLLYERSSDQLMLIPGANVSTPYDNLILRLDGAPSSTVHIERLDALKDTVLTDAAGNTIELITEVEDVSIYDEEDGDGLLAETLDIVREKGE